MKKREFNILVGEIYDPSTERNLYKDIIRVDEKQLNLLKRFCFVFKDQYLEEYYSLNGIFFKVVEVKVKVEEKKSPPLSTPIFNSKEVAVLSRIVQSIKNNKKVNKESGDVVEMGKIIEKMLEVI